MSDTQAKYHHLIPQTYYSAWEHGKGTLYAKSLSDNRIRERNKNKIAGIKNYHSIIAGMPIVTKEDADIIFGSLKDYIVSYEGKTISDSLDFNKTYYDFDNWIITRQDGGFVSKKRIKAEIEKVKIKDIETQWNLKYENEWAIVRDELIEKINNATTDHIIEIHRDYLMRFYTILDWRSIESNKYFIGAWKWLCGEVLHFDKIDIPEEDREIPILDTVSEKLKHELLLSYYRKFLNDEGVIYDCFLKNNEITTFCFVVADGKETFYTSDNPAFVFEREAGSLQGVLPLSPRILMVQCKKSNSDNYYYITHITDEEVRYYNSQIEKNASSFIIQENA